MFESDSHKVFYTTLYIYIYNIYKLAAEEIFKFGLPLKLQDSLVREGSIRPEESSTKCKLLLGKTTIILVLCIIVGNTMLLEDSSK